MVTGSGEGKAWEGKALARGRAAHREPKGRQAAQRPWAATRGPVLAPGGRSAGPVLAGLRPSRVRWRSPYVGSGRVAAASRGPACAVLVASARGCRLRL